MTDNLESNSPNGSAGLPNSDASQGTSDKPPSTFDASKLPEQLESLVKSAVAKAFEKPELLQGIKDKRFSTIEKQLEDFKPVLEQVKSLLTPDQLKEFNQIQKDAEFEELKRRVYGDTSTGTLTNGTQKSTATSDAQGVLLQIVDELLELPTNDSRVTQLKLDYGNDTNAYKEQAKKLKASLAAGNPTPAEQLLPGGTSIQKGDVNAMISELNEWQKTPSQYREQIKARVAELDKRGWK